VNGNRKARQYESLAQTSFMEETVQNRQISELLFKTLFQDAFKRQLDLERVASVQFLTNRASTPCRRRPRRLVLGVAARNRNVANAQWTSFPAHII
jgi:hypothetical protein